MADNIIEFKNISKHFGGTTALDQVTFEVEKGSVVGLVGENGAGKSTLVKITGGVLSPDEGKIVYDGQEISIDSPKNAEEIGISIVHQELPICENLTVAQNIFLGADLPGKGMFPDRKYMYNKSLELFEQLDIKLDPDKPVSECSMGERQLIIIASAISKNSKFILMDEPTTALSPSEVEVLYDVIENLKAQGISIVFISHRLNEILKVSDKIHVLKDGSYVGNLDQEEADEDQITNMMVGREVKIKERKEKYLNPDKVALEVKNLNHAELGLEDISFKLHEGEILGIAGLRGAGRSELARNIIGNFEPDSGEIYVKGNKVEINSPKDAIDNGIGYLPEDRGELGLFKQLDVRSNMNIANLDALSSKSGLVNRRKMTEITHKYENDLEIKMRSITQNIDSLSGGNQQKVLIGRWLAVQPDVLIMDEPTRGIDVGTKSEIRELITNLSKEGFSIIMISSEMLEVMAISDRILVMSQGELTGEFSHEEATENKIMKAAVEEN